MLPEHPFPDFMGFVNCQNGHVWLFAPQKSMQTMPLQTGIPHQDTGEMSVFETLRPKFQTAYYLPEHTSMPVKTALLLKRRRLTSTAEQKFHTETHAQADDLIPDIQNRITGGCC